MKVSRLEVSFVLEMNQGPYTCISENKAGLASTNFTLNILPGSVDDTFPSDHSSSSSDDFPNAEASQNSHTKSEKDKNPDSTNNNNNQFKNNNNSIDTKLKSIGTESMVYGLIIGILVGIVLVLVTLSAAIVVMCRKKSNQRSRISSSSSSFNTHHTKSDNHSTLDRMATLGGLATESELEKLTPSSLSTSSHVLMMGMIPSGKSDHCSEHEQSRFLLPHTQHDPSAVNREMMFDPYEGSIYGRLNSSNGTSNLSGSVINPVQKPPRIGFGDQIDVPAGIQN